MLVKWVGDGYETSSEHDECVYVYDDETMLRLAVGYFDELDDIKSDGSRITRFIYKDKLYVNVSTIAQHCSDLRELSDLILKLKQIFKLKRLEGGLGYLAMRMFLRNAKKKVFRLNRQANQFIAESFRGGRCECYVKGKVSNVNIYDVNSCYPHAMTFAFPRGYGYITKKFNEKQLGWWRVRFSGDRDYFVDYRSKLYEAEGEGILTTEEVLFAIENQFKIEVREGLVFSQQDYTFRDFVTRMYELRKNIEDARVRKIIKLCLNSLSMKFAQKEIVYKLQRVNSVEDLRNAVQISDEFVLVKSYKKNIYSNVAISALVTSRARLQLYRAMQKVNTLYCDTDSIHTQDDDVERKIKVGDELGEWKIQALNVTVTYQNRKMYYIHDTDQLKAAGARVVKREKIDRTQVFVCERLASLEEILTQRQVIKHQYTFVV